MKSPRSSLQSFNWDPGAYAAHSGPQQAWARELISTLELRGGERVLDVGCGDGKVTAELARALPRGGAVGIDASPQMIEFARAAFPAGRVPNVEFHVMDAREIRFGRPFDVVFSNAALHWVDDHESFLRGAAGCLRRGGRLVVSCGGRGNAHDVFVALRPELRTRRWREFFRGLQAAYFFHRPEDYGRWLGECGFEVRRLQLAPKDAVYDGRDGFATWLRTTWLPYTQRVPEPMREEFIAAVTDRYLAKHPADAKGRVHVRMMRLEIDAIRI